MKVKKIPTTPIRRSTSKILPRSRKFIFLLWRTMWASEQEYIYLPTGEKDPEILRKFINEELNVIIHELELVRDCAVTVRIAPPSAVHPNVLKTISNALAERESKLSKNWYARATDTTLFIDAKCLYE